MWVFDYIYNSFRIHFLLTLFYKQKSMNNNNFFKNWCIDSIFSSVLQTVQGLEIEDEDDEQAKKKQ